MQRGSVLHDIIKLLGLCCRKLTSLHPSAKIMSHMYLFVPATFPFTSENCSYSLILIDSAEGRRHFSKNGVHAILLPQV